jgi:hypothetical protein
VKRYTYNWEIQTLVEQFASAFNDIIIKRYEPNVKISESSVSQHKVSFVYAPKQRVFSSLTNPAPGGMTLPIVSITINRISRDQQRVFNKIEGFNINYNQKINSEQLIKKIPPPIPINIGVNMSIITKYQSDMDQIITNFVPYCDPYIIISWKIPALDKSKVDYEIRTEVLWSGDINMQYPTDLQGNQPFRVVADTTFTIKGWMFKNVNDIYKKIYTIDSDFLDMNCIEKNLNENPFLNFDDLIENDLEEEKCCK